MSMGAFRSLLCLALLLLVQNLNGFAAHAQADASATNAAVIDIGNGIDPGNINPLVQYHIEADGTLDLRQVIGRSDEIAFKPVETIEPDFGYISEGIWLKLELRNVSDEVQHRYLMLHNNFMPDIAAYLVTPQGQQLLLEQDENSTFDTRPVPYHQLIAPFEMDPGQSGAIYIRYSSNGDTVLPLSLVDEIGLATVTNRQLIVDFAFYGLMAMVILASIFGRIFFPNPTFVAYGFYVLGVLLLIFQRDGYALQFLWPNSPHWNDFSSLPLGASLPLLAAIFTRSYLGTKTLHPHMDKVLIGICVLQVALVASFPVIGISAAKQGAFVTVGFSIIVFLSIGVFAYRKYGRRALFFLIGWLGFLAGTIVMMAVQWTDISITRAQSLDVMRGSMVFDALMMGLASVFRVVDLQKEHLRLNEERMAILHTNVQLHDRFARLEQRYQLAQEIARSSNEKVTDLTHDLRQPLFALRASISEFASSGTGDAKREEIASSFEYIESLVENALTASIESEEASPGADADTSERTKANDLFKSLDGMFREEAKAKGVDLKFVPSDATLSHAPFPLLRIMANFIANAIQHAPGSRVLVGCRRRRGGVSVAVYDNGPGVPEAQLGQIRQRLARGGEDASDAQGHGVGLSIVGKIAAEHDLDWSIDSVEGRGTAAYLIV